MIVTANHWFADGPKPAPTWAAFKATFLLRHMVRHGVQGRGLADAPALPAIVRQGKWLALCPCGGAEKVWEEGQMMCCSCLNGHAAHQFLRTEFPQQRAAIEAILEFRPVENRNWEPPETVADLARENRDHGLGEV